MSRKQQSFSYRIPWYTKNYKNGILLGSDSGVGFYPTTMDIISSPVPDWIAKIRAGSQATGGLSATWDSQKPSPTSLSISYKVALTGAAAKDVYAEEKWGTYGLTSSLFAFADKMGVADNLARDALFKSAVGTRRALQGGVAIGEIREVMHMLRNPAQRLEQSLFTLKEDYRKILKSIKRAKVNVRKTNDKLRGAYLEQAYGWAPLISQTKEAAEVLAEKQLGMSREVQFVRSQNEQKSSRTTTQLSGSGNFQWFRNQKQERVDKVKYLAALTGVSPSPLLRTMSDLGFSPEDFIPTIWELIPYSFVADYFTNTGTVLDAWSHRSIGYGWAQKTTVSFRTSEIHLISNTSAYQNSQNHYVTSLNERHGKVTRRQGTILRSEWDETDLSPTLHFEVPGIRQAFNTVVLMDGFRRLTNGFVKGVKFLGGR